MISNDNATLSTENCNDYEELIMSLWIANNVAECSGLGSFRAEAAFRLFIQDLNNSSINLASLMTRKPSRVLFYKRLKQSLANGAIRSSSASESTEAFSRTDFPFTKVKVTRRNQGLFFEGFHIQKYPQQPEDTSLLPSLLNKNEERKLLEFIRKTPLENLFRRQNAGAPNTK